MRKQLLALTTTAILGLTSSANEYIPTDATANSCNALGIDLYQLLYKKGENICISPYSIQAALLMTHHGADKETLLEMQKVLHVDAASPSSAELVKSHLIYTRKIKQRLDKAIPRYQETSKTQLKIANRIFLEQSYQPEQSFLDLCKENYNAPVESLDFKTAADKSRLHINQWVSKETNDKIKDLLGEGSIDKETKMVLTNCLYFKASWSKAFRKQNTKPMAFHNVPNGQSMVETMHLTSNFGYKKAADYQAVTIPFGANQNFQMLVVLPNEGNDLDKVVNQLKQIDPKSSRPSLLSFSQLANKRIALSLPKFKLEPSSLSLKNSLAQLGMKSSFTNVANFSKMAKSNDLKIADVVHKTYIAIDEGGAEAAAATAVPMAAKCGGTHNPNKPIEFKVNRPFFFAIQDRQSGHCYFIGSIQKL